MMIVYLLVTRNFARRCGLETNNQPLSSQQNGWETPLELSILGVGIERQVAEFSVERLGN